MRPHRLPSVGRRHARPAWALLCAVLLTTGALPGTALAGTTISLFKSFAGNVNFVTTGNTLRAADNTVNACSLLSGLNGTAVNAGTSSGTVTGVPVGSTIVAAYLYYAGSGNTVDTTVTFNGTAVTADRTFTDTTLDPFFGGFKDVTSLVTGNATYSFTGLAVNTSANPWCNDQTVLAGWALVVIYSNTSEAYRVINVYDGFQFFQNSSITLTPANFKIPTPPVAGSKFAVITWEGDDTLSGNETLEFNGNVLTDTCNGANNQYNGTINYNGGLTNTCTGVAATDDVYYGVDIDTFPVDADVAAGQTSATTFYQSGQDAVVLAAQIISISDAPVSDLSITKVHSGPFGYGDNGSYIITVTNNGPTTTSGTTKVTDTLPAGETFVSATGSGWSCANASGTVTCSSTAAVVSGGSFNPITLTVAVATSAGTSIANTATASVDPSDFDNNSGNNSSTDTVSNAGSSLVHPDLSTSTKTVFNPGGGDYNVGDTVQYTITLNETAGVDASAVSVSDNIPASLSGFVGTAVTVTGSTTTITNSSTNTGGTNGDGLLSISNITVPANGSVTIVFTAQVATGTANCATINNSGTITYAGGNPTTATVTAPTVIVAQSNCTSSGNKLLYLYGTNIGTNTYEMSRTPTATNTSVSVGTTQINWEQQPVAQKSIVIPAQTVSVALYMTRSGANSNRTIKVGLAKNSALGTLLGSQTQTFNPGAAESLHTFTFTITATTVAVGDALVLEIGNTTGGANTVNVFPLNGTAKSAITFATSTVINVDSVTSYNAVYPATTQTTVYSPNSTVFVCAVISDPFGSADVSSATITLTDSTGTVQVSAAAMTAKGATDCSGAANAADEAFEYSYTIPAPGTAAVGFWTTTVTGNEGSEGTVTHTANGSFDVDVPALLIAKSVAVATDPIEGATRSKAIPGATVQYTIQVQNNGRGSVDSGTFVITDPVPTNTVLSLPAKPPFTFTDGATASGLSVTSGSDASISYSNNGGTTYVYTPSCTRPCTDAAITNFKITLTGAMNGKTGASAPSFTITYNVVLQ